MHNIENSVRPRSTAAFVTLLEKLDAAFSAPEANTQFGAAEASQAGAFVEDAMSMQDVMESTDGV